MGLRRAWLRFSFRLVGRVGGGGGRGGFGSHDRAYSRVFTPLVLRCCEVFYGVMMYCVRRVGYGTRRSGIEAVRALVATRHARCHPQRFGSSLLLLRMASIGATAIHSRTTNLLRRSRRGGTDRPNRRGCGWIAPSRQARRENVDSRPLARIPPCRVHPLLVSRACRAESFGERMARVFVFVFVFAALPLVRPVSSHPHSSSLALLFSSLLTFRVTWRA